MDKIQCKVTYIYDFTNHVTFTFVIILILQWIKYVQSNRRRARVAQWVRSINQSNRRYLN